MKIDGKKVKVEKETGFTLTELLVVLLVVGLLAATVGPSIYQKINPAKTKIAKAQIYQISNALDSFYLDVGRFPSVEEGVSSLYFDQTGISGWAGPYLKSAVPSDPWGKDYQYRSPGRIAPYEVFSYGADGKEGGQGENADITSW